MSSNEQDIWNRKRDQGPPDLIKLIKNIFNSEKNNSPFKNGEFTFVLTIIFGIFIVLYFLSGFYIVREPERGVITRLGKFHEIKYSGLNWHPRFIDKVYIVDVEAIDSFKKDHRMLTEDENIINAGFEIQYRKNNPAEFLFNDAQPITTLHQLTESAIRDVIGHSKLDAILTNGKQEITRQIKKVIEHSLLNYKLGIELLDVNLSSALPPTPVQQAFNDVIKAREDEQAYQNEAERYKESQLPIALGRAKRIHFEADAYKKEKILKAQAQAQRFTLLEEQYNQYPKLMKTRLYHETMDEVLSNVTKIIVDPDLSHHMMYLNSLNENALVSLEKKASDASSAQSINLTTPEKIPSKGSHQYFSGETPLNFNKD